jgi:hypothetical protein
MVSLIEKWNNATGTDAPEFGARVAMALAKRAGVELDTLVGGTNTEPVYNRYIRMANYILYAGPQDLDIFVRIFASGNMSNANSDTEISDAVVLYWDTLSLLFDPNVPGTG